MSNVERREPSIATPPLPAGEGRGEGAHPGQVPEPAPARLTSLDFFRGATIAGMLVVNTPGSWDHVFGQLLHAEWHDWTYTDTIFPFFLFIVGVSMAFSFARRSARGGPGPSREARLATFEARPSRADESQPGLVEGADRGALLLHTLRRAAIIFGLGLGLNILSYFLFHRAQVRIPGVLQRIAVCFFFAAVIYVLFGRRWVLPAAAMLLAVHWALLTFVPVPGHGAGLLDVEWNIGAYVDRMVLGSHTWKHDPGWDPEGIVSSLSAIATTLFGIVAGEWLRRNAAWGPRLAGLMGGGAVAFSLGLAWGVALPINKNLWTPSYALLMAGLAAMCLALSLWVVDVKGWKGWAKPFLWLGTNAIAAFVLSTLGTLLLLWIKVTGDDGKRRSLYGTIYRVVFDHFADPRIGSLLFALAYLAVWTAVFGVFYRKKIFIKV